MLQKMMLDKTKNIIKEIFGSENMKKYLCEHVAELEQWQVIDMLGGAPIPLAKKYELFCELAETDITSDSTFGKMIDEEYSFANYARAIQNAFHELYTEDGLLLLTKHRRCENKQCLLDCELFADYEKLKFYLENENSWDESNGYSDCTWYLIWKYCNNGELTVTYSYLQMYGSIMYFSDNMKGIDCWLNPDLNLPVPFKKGDVIATSSEPFFGEKTALISEIGDNRDCCCIQVRSSQDRKAVALKHGTHFFETDVCLSPLYRIEKTDTFL